MPVIVKETPMKLKRGQAGGIALVQKHGRDYMSDIGRRGGRPRSLIIDAFTSSGTVSGAQDIKKEVVPGKGRKELLKLWKEKQGRALG